MKLGIVNSNFSLGGAQRVAIEIAKGLSLSTEYEIDLVDFSGENIFFYEDIGLCNKIVNPSKKRNTEKICHRLYKYRYKFFKKRFHVSSMLQNQIEGLISVIKERKYDVIILCQGILTTLLPRFKKQFPDIKFIAWQHSSYYTYIKKYNASFLEEYLMALEQADEVICLTLEDQRLFQKHNKKTRAIHNPLTIMSNKISNLKNNTIVFVSRIDTEPKGLDYLIELIKRSPADWNYGIAGDGKDIAKFKKLITENNLNDKLILKGALVGEDLVNHYLEGSVFVSTSRWEGFGLALTEAMSCGLPVISFNNSGPKEILDDGKYGILIDKFDIDYFFNELEKLMNNENIRKIYQQKSLQRANDFSLEAIVAKWLEVLQGETLYG